MKYNDLKTLYDNCDTPKVFIGILEDLLKKFELSDFVELCYDCGIERLFLVRDISSHERLSKTIDEVISFIRKKIEFEKFSDPKAADSYSDSDIDTQVDDEVYAYNSDFDSELDDEINEDNSDFDCESDDEINEDNSDSDSDSELDDEIWFECESIPAKLVKGTNLVEVLKTYSLRHFVDVCQKDGKGAVFTLEEMAQENTLKDIAQCIDSSLPEVAPARDSQKRRSVSENPNRELENACIGSCALPQDKLDEADQTPSHCGVDKPKNVKQKSNSKLTSLSSVKTLVSSGSLLQARKILMKPIHHVSKLMVSGSELMAKVLSISWSVGEGIAGYFGAMVVRGYFEFQQDFARFLTKLPSLFARGGLSKKFLNNQKVSKAKSNEFHRSVNPVRRRNRRSGISLLRSGLFL